MQSDIRAKLSDLLEVEITSAVLSENDAAYLQQNFHCLEDLEAIWAAMDAEWIAQGAGFDEEERDAMGRFYRAPVWLLNGIFTELDPVSRAHRDAIRSFVAEQQPGTVADYGGGFGTLARKIAGALPNARVMVVEPYPSSLALVLAESYTNLDFVEKLKTDTDIIVAQDVLEHVTDPLNLFYKLLSSTKIDGRVITANCFHPVILCHYPDAFHFHFTFSRIAPYLGCRYEGTVPNAPHAQIFRKVSNKPNWTAARKLESFSRTAFPFLKKLQRLKKRFTGPAGRI